MAYQLQHFQAEHLEDLVGSEPGEVPEEMQNREFYELLEAQPNSWTLLRDGVPIWCGGTIEQWPGRHIGWSYVAQAAGPSMKRVTRDATWVLNQAPGRTEITVQADFSAGHRWARLLGFEVEAPLMKAFGPAGEDHVGYVRFA